MRTALALSAVLLAACQAPATEPPIETACGAAALQHLVGAPVARADGVTAPGPVRVFQTGDPLTMDYRPERLNIEYSDRGRIVRVFCG